MTLALASAEIMAPHAGHEVILIMMLAVFPAAAASASRSPHAPIRAALLRFPLLA